MEHIDIKKQPESLEVESSKEDIKLSEEILDFAQKRAEEHEKSHGYGFKKEEMVPYEVINDYTSTGEAVQFESLVVKPDRATETRITPLFYVAQLKNSKGEVVGTSEIFAFNFKGQKPDITRGVSIDKRYRGQGYGSILSNFSDRVICDLDKTEEFNGITNNIHNLNIRHMQSTLDKMISGEKDFDEDLVDSLINESKRWEKVFVEKYVNHNDLKLRATAESEIGNFINKVENTEFKGELSKEEALKRATVIEEKFTKYYGDNRAITTTAIIQPKETYLKEMREREEKLARKNDN